MPLSYKISNCKFRKNISAHPPCCLPFSQVRRTIEESIKAPVETLSVNVLTSRSMLPISISFGSGGCVRYDRGMGRG